MEAQPRKSVVLRTTNPKKITKIQFGTLPTEDIQKVSEVRVSSRTIFSLPNAQNPTRHPAVNGVMDPRMGISGKTNPDRCATCLKTLQVCSGHFGYIQLELPVFHAGYFKHTLAILQCICKKCCRVQIPPSEHAVLLRKLSDPRSQGALTRAAFFKRVLDTCKSAQRCPYCGYSNGVVKKASGAFFKILHEIWRAKFSDEHFDAYKKAMDPIAAAHPELSTSLMKQTELINPLRAFELLSRIPEIDFPLLWMNGDFGRPDTLIIWAIPVPPVPIRPSVPQEMGGGSTEDDITIKLQEIAEVNNALRLALGRGANMRIVVEDWDFLQIQVALFINGETPGIPRQLAGARSIRGLCQRLKGKQGRFRGNLSGKRVDFSGRTVISPDPNLRVDQVGVPVLVAKILTYPEKVHRYNIDRLRAVIMNGPEKHPGANSVRTETGMVTNLTWGDKEKAASALKIGDIVERHMHDGDIVLFNRQPSLHKMSIMAHEVKVMPWRTFRFNECACTPYNADFDGDEMNLHLPQTEEARAEAAELMLITRNLITPRNGEPLVAATQDFLTGAYLLTQRDVFLSRAEFCRLVAFLSDALEHVELPPPTIFKPLELWTGKQVITMLIRPCSDGRMPHSYPRVNLESEEKFYKSNAHFCSEDGYVAFRGGEHLCGSLGKKTLGGESKNGLFYVLVRDYGYEEAIRCMSRLAKLCARYLGDRGFSIGVDDVTPTARMVERKTAVLAEGQRKADAEIELYKNGNIKLKPGCDALQSLESEVNGLLGRIREQCGQYALGELNYKNSPLTMAQCGSKGSPINISQMMACLGQQTVGGSRIQDGFVNRTLPHFAPGALSPAGKGFVANSFFSGLTATEFFFHTMGGREGLVDTAVKTAETGYMARRLMKALEDLSMQYDYTVRNSEQTVVQFSYGDDGLNPQIMERGDRPVNFSRLLVNEIERSNLAQRGAQSLGTSASSASSSGSGSSLGRAPRGKRKSAEETTADAMAADPPSSATSANTQLTSVELLALLEEELAAEQFTSLLPLGQKFVAETREFFVQYAKSIAALETLAGLDFDAGSQGLEDPEAIRLRLAKLTPAGKEAWIARSRVPGTKEFKDTYRLVACNTQPLTRSQLRNILADAVRRYSVAMVQPGEAVGAVGAQSLSEPGTQMTLKTFHFAGVASMNVTLGVPRLKEIINASKVISTPIIKAPLVQADSVLSARIVKAQIEKTTLGEVSTYIREVHSPTASYISIHLDQQAIQNLHLHITASTIKQAILSSGSSSTGTVKSPILRLLKPFHIQVWGTTGMRLHIVPPELKDPKEKDEDIGVGRGGRRAPGSSTTTGLPARRKLYFTLQALKAALPHVIVQGFSTVSRAVINEGVDDRSGDKTYHLLVEGYGLQEVMGCQGVDGRETVSNHIMDMQQVLGIEAARCVIASEIGFIMKCYGILVDCRHLMLLSDVMTFKGEVLGITRFGVAKMRESVLMLASFEKTTDHLFDAAVHSREDAIVGVSECIIMGTPIPIGTGIMKMLQKRPPVEFQPRVRLLDRLV